VGFGVAKRSGHHATRCLCNLSLNVLVRALELQRSRERLCAVRRSMRAVAFPLSRPLPSVVFVQNESGDPLRQAFEAGGESFSYCCQRRRHLVVLHKTLPSHLRAQDPALADVFAEQRRNSEANARGVIIHADDAHNSIEVIRRMMEEISTFCGFININKMIPWLKIIILIK